MVFFDGVANHHESDQFAVYLDVPRAKFGGGRLPMSAELSF